MDVRAHEPTLLAPNPNAWPLQPANFHGRPSHEIQISVSHNNQVQVSFASPGQA